MKATIKILDSFEFKFYFLDSIDSTNSFLKEKLKSNSFPRVFCNTVEQTNGYGQRSQSWVSNRSSLKFSIGIELKGSIEDLFSSGLQLALSLRKILSNFHTEQLKVKWPNDIYSSNGKICGILTELVKNRLDGKSYIVIGIGINVDFCPLGKEFKSDAVSLASLEEILKVLLVDIDAIYNTKKKDKGRLLNEWDEFDYFDKNSGVIVLDNLYTRSGIYNGLSVNFMPIVQFEKELVEYRSANISLKRKVLL